MSRVASPGRCSRRKDESPGGTDTHGVLDQARLLLREEYGIDHATLQIEPDTHEGCDELAW